MKEIEKLKQEKDELQKGIKELVDEFMHKIGVCDISVIIENHTTHSRFEKAMLISTNVEVNVTI